MAPAVTLSSTKCFFHSLPKSITPLTLVRRAVAQSPFYLFWKYEIARTRAIEGLHMQFMELTF